MPAPNPAARPAHPAKYRASNPLNPAGKVSMELAQPVSPECRGADHGNRVGVCRIPEQAFGVPVDPESTRPVRRRQRKPIPVEIRAMEIRDLGPVFELGQILFTAEKWPTLYRSWDEREILALFHSDSETCLVAECDGRLIGFALGRVMEKPRSAWRYGWLMWLGVRPEFHRGRVATRLLRRLTELFVMREARIMLVDTDEANRLAIAFFKRQGFGQAVRHVYMSRNLDDHPRSIERRFEEGDDDDS